MLDEYAPPGIFHAVDHAVFSPVEAFAAALGRVSRAFVVVLDACGVGELPDAAAYGDAGENTLGHLAREAGGLALPTLAAPRTRFDSRCGRRAPPRSPVVHGRLHALGPGKDSTAGHWELMGIVVSQAPPTYPSGFPDEVIELVRRGQQARDHLQPPLQRARRDRGLRCEHVRTGDLIVYTSQDSVLQIAAHEHVVPSEELYAVCQQVRALATRRARRRAGDRAPVRRFRHGFSAHGRPA